MSTNVRSIFVYTICLKKMIPIINVNSRGPAIWGITSVVLWGHYRNPSPPDHLTRTNLVMWIEAFEVEIYSFPHIPLHTQISRPHKNRWTSPSSLHSTPSLDNRSKTLAPLLSPTLCTTVRQHHCLLSTHITPPPGLFLSLSLLSSISVRVRVYGMENIIVYLPIYMGLVV